MIMSLLTFSTVMILFVQVEEVRAANAVARHCLWLDRYTKHNNRITGIQCLVRKSSLNR